MANEPVDRRVDRRAFLARSVCSPRWLGEDPQDPRTQGLPPVPDLITAASPVRREGKVSLRWQTRTGVLPGFADGTSETANARKAYLTKLASIPDARLFDHCDVVVQTGPVPFDILGLPEIAFPIGFTAAGLPIGTILGGLPYGEDRLLAVAAAYQAVTDWHWRRPAARSRTSRTQTATR